MRLHVERLSMSFVESEACAISSTPVGVNDGKFFNDCCPSPKPASWKLNVSLSNEKTPIDRWLFKLVSTGEAVLLALRHAPSKPQTFDGLGT